MSKWIPVQSYKDVPEGNWLVKIEDDRNPFHVANIHPNITTIGGCFYFDKKRVISYFDTPVEEI